MNESSLDRIHIRDLRARCIVGVFPEEREKAQEIIINIILYADLRKAGESDALEDTVDYKEVKQRVLAYVETSACFLVEKLARHIADICLDASGVQEVTVTVDKPGALRFARSVAVEITRKRAEEG